MPAVTQAHQPCYWLRCISFPEGSAPTAGTKDYGERMADLVTRGRRRALKAFGRSQRIVAWSMLAVGLVVAFSVLASILKVPDKPSALLLALTVIYQGFEAVQEVENELDSEGSVEE